MAGVPLGQGAYNRTYAQEPEIELLNRFLEQNPTNLVEKVAALTRPGNTFFGAFGSGQARVIAHQPGAFSDDLFVVMGSTLYRWDGVGAPIALTGVIQGTGKPATAFVVGAGYEHLFIADGLTLRYYDGEAAATGTLTVAAGNIVATDTVTLDTVYYEWTSGSVDAGTPNGTLATPWLVALGVSDTEALANLLAALNVSGTAGTTYSTGLAAHTTVTGVLSDATTLSVRAKTRGTVGNTIATMETGANISWGAPTLQGGGAQALNGVVTPDDVSIVSLASLKSHVVAVVSNSQRFYWILPGNVTIDPLDFAEAESEPDQVIEVVRVGDHIWLLGETSSEVWYVNPQVDLGLNGSRFIPQQGLSFGQGAVEGTSVVIRNQLYVVSEDGIGYKLAGGAQRVTTHGTEERIRLAREALG